MTGAATRRPLFFIRELYYTLVLARIIWAWEIQFNDSIIKYLNNKTIIPQTQTARPQDRKTATTAGPII